MNKIYKIVSLTLVWAASSLTGCENLTDNYSTDPVKITDPSVISISKYLSGIEISLIAVYEGDLGFYAGLWSNYFSGEERQFVAFSNYIISADYMDNCWQIIYNKILKNHLLLEEKAKAENNYRALAISQTNLALAMGLAADLWGDVPYTEAGKYPAILNPKFDSQSSIYAVVQTLLDDAMANFNKNVGSADGDFFLNGNIDLWIKVIHSAKARYYLHTKDYQKAIEQGRLGISKADENLIAPHGSTIHKDSNIFYSFLTQDRVGYMSANCDAPKLLDAANTDTVKKYRGNSKTDETARLWWYYTPNPKKDDPNKLYDLSYTCAEKGGKCSGFFSSNASFPLISFEETMLILAEAYMKQGTPDPAQALSYLNTLRQYYNTGAPFKNSAFLKKTYKYDDYTMDDFAVGGIANTKKEDQNTALLREILEERYVSFIGQFEGWNDMRRTKNFLGLPLVQGKTDFPKRMIYPQIEVNTNTQTPTGVGLFTDVPSFSTPY